MDPGGARSATRTLNKLMAEALRSAPDIAEAEARIREARAQRGIAGAAQYPTAEAGAAYDRTRGSANVPIGVPPGGLGPGVGDNLWQMGFDASWEIDVFGGERRAVEAADASYQAVVEDRGDVELTLLAEIARDYIELRGTQRQLAVAHENIAIQQDALALDTVTIRRGPGVEPDVLRAQAQVWQTPKPQFPPSRPMSALRSIASAHSSDTRRKICWRN